MALAKQAHELNHLIEVGETLEAINRFYAEDVVMQENHESPRVGKAVYIAHEQQNLAKVRSVSAKLLSQAIDAERQTVFSEWRFTFTDLEDKHFLLEEVSVQHWQNGRVVRERFYYNTAVAVD